MNINISKVKIVVTIPIENTEEIKKAIGDVGAGVIGNYSYCTVSTRCTGTFKGNNDSNPNIGEKNILISVIEDKIEVQCDIRIVKKVIKVIRTVHPYEEPAIDIIPLINEEDL